jgi:hypothetical protein
MYRSTRPRWFLWSVRGRVVPHLQVPAEPGQHPLTDLFVQLAAIERLQVRSEERLRALEDRPGLLTVRGAEWRGLVAPGYGVCGSHSRHGSISYRSPLCPVRHG